MNPNPRVRAWRPLADLTAGLASAGIVVALAFVILIRASPPWVLPWTPLDLDQPVGPFTRAKLERLESDPDTCLRLLTNAGVAFDRAPDRDDGGFCVVENAVRLRSGVTPLRPADLVLRCPHAAALVIWDRQTLRPVARELLDREPVALETYGSYACRRVYGEATGRPSEHARANALDIAGVRLSGGGRVTVAGDWSDPEAPAEAEFLRALRDGACEVFGAVLGPEYNAAHQDHLHLDRGPYRICR